MKILLMDILRTSLEEVWPTAEHSLGLMYLSSCIKQNFNSKVQTDIWTLVSKPRFKDEDITNILNKLNEYKPDLVGIRSLSIGKDIFHLTAKTVKEWNKDCLVIGGGPYPTDDPADALNKGYVDCVVIGEGEITFGELVKNILHYKNWNEVNGIAYVNNGKVIKTSPRQLIEELDCLPFPDYSTIDLDRFSNQFMTFTSKISLPHGNIMTTRGCPYRCAYCHNILGKNFRVRSSDSVLKEIRYIHDTFGITDFQIIDDIFNLDLVRAKEICDLIIKSRMKLTFSFPNGLRGDRIDEELLDKMAEAGTKFISYAIETASPRLQKMIHKNLDLNKLFNAIEYTTKVGIVTRGFFMLGFPTETEEEIAKTIQYAKDSALCGATFFTVVYFPGTELYKIAKSLGYFQDDDYDVKRDYVNVSQGPYNCTAERLIELKRKGIKEFAFTKERIERVNGMLSGYFTQREIDGFYMAYVVSSQAKLEDIEDVELRNRLRRYFVIADRFSKKGEFYV